MKCPRCQAENSPDRTYCASCGAPLGVICDRCGLVNNLADKYCGKCGFALIQFVSPHLEDASTESAPPIPVSMQYNERDIRELMALRLRMKKEEDLAENLRQDDINKLFG